MSAHLETVIEFEPRAKGRTGWWQIVTIESNGTRHALTVSAESTPAAARRRAKVEGVRFVEIAQ